MRPGDLVILIAYFGFPCDEAVCAQVKQQGAWVLADASQALLSTKIGQSADFVLYSPRKFLGVPDGGILQINHPAGWPDLSLQAPPADWWLKTFTAAILRRDFDGAPPRFPAGQGGKRQWLRLYQEAEREAPTGPYAMTELSRSLLLHYFDYPAIAAQRIANYRFLSTHLSEIALYPQLAPGVVPLGFPIRLRDQDRVRQLLFARAIYPPVHWPLAGWVPSEFTDSHRLSTEIMTLPCDQRYALADMESILQALQSC